MGIDFQNGDATPDEWDHIVDVHIKPLMAAHQVVALGWIQLADGRLDGLPVLGFTARHDVNLDTLQETMIAGIVHFIDAEKKRRAARGN